MRPLPAQPGSMLSELLDLSLGRILPPFKLPQSVLVVIYTPALDVLLIRRSDMGTWQSVTGSKDSLNESWRETAAREVLEETGIACGPGSALEASLQDWYLENIYDIYLTCPP